MFEWQHFRKSVDRYLFTIIPEWMTIIKYPDELVGTWEVLKEDGFHMMMSEGIEFGKGGVGTYRSRSALDQGQTEQDFSWKRIGSRTIRIRAAGDTDWDIAEYEIRPFTSNLHINYLRLSDTVNNAGLWLATQPLYKAFK